MSIAVKREVPTIPAEYLIRLPQKRDKNGKPRPDKEYITSEGLIYLGHLQGLKRVTADCILVPTPEKPWAIVRCEVETELGIFSDYGEVGPNNQGTVGGSYPLSMASTRARNRALRIATGCPIASYEEMGGTYATVDEAPLGTDPDTGEVSEPSQPAAARPPTEPTPIRKPLLTDPAPDGWRAHALELATKLWDRTGIETDLPNELTRKECRVLITSLTEQLAALGDQLPAIEPVAAKGDGLFPDGVQAPAGAGAAT